MNEENERSVTLGDLLTAVKKNILMVAIITVVIATIGFIYTFFIVKENYKSSTTVVVTVSESGDSTKADDINNSFKLIQTVVELTSQDSVILPVAKKYAVSGKETEFALALKKNLNVSYQSSSFLVTISVNGTDPLKTQVYANEITTSLINVCNTDKSLQKLLFDSVSVMTEASLGIYDSPNKLLYLSAFIALGIALGIGCAFIKEFMSNRFKTKDEVKISLSCDIIGTLYDLNKLSDTKSLVNLSERTSRIMAYNRLFSNLKYLSFSSYAKTIMVTSTGEDELKTTTVANLGCVMAMNKKKVLIIDMDFRRPEVYKLFGLSIKGGITDYLDGNNSYKEIIKHTKMNVDVMTVGQSLLNPGVVIESEGMKDLLQEAKLNYDYILIDTPPLLAASDAQAIAKMTDGVIYNVRINKYKRNMVYDSYSLLKTAGANILGVNVTFIPLSKNSYNYYYSDNNDNV